MLLNNITSEEALLLFQARITKLFMQTKGKNGKRLKRMKLSYNMCHALTEEQQDSFDDLINDWWDHGW